MNFVLNDKIFEKFPALTTERLLLEEIEDIHADDMFKIRSDERVVRYLDREPHKTVEESMEMISSIRKSYSEKNGIDWAIINRSTQEVIGYIGYWRLLRERVRAEIGYALKPEFWHKGIMKEALVKVIEFGFEQFGLHSIEANINPLNIGSIKLLEKAGFKKEAYFREDFLFNGRYVDSVIYSLLETDNYLKVP